MSVSHSSLRSYHTLYTFPALIRERQHVRILFVSFSFPFLGFKLDIFRVKKRELAELRQINSFINTIHGSSALCLKPHPGLVDSAGEGN